MHCFTIVKYIKYFDNGGKNISFKIKSDVLVKYNEIWNRIKKC